MAATHSKPTKINEWADTGTIVEPSEAKKDSGWVGTEKPPATYFNWWQNLSGQWTKWIDERFDDGSDEDELVLRNPDTAGEVFRLMTVSGNDGVQLFGDNQMQVYKDGAGDFIFQVDFQDSWQFDSDLNTFVWETNGNPIAKLSVNGMHIYGGLAVGSSTVSPSDSLKVLQFGNDSQPSLDGDFWIGWTSPSEDAATIRLSDSESIFIDALADNLRIFHGAGASFFGYAGTDDVSFGGDVEIEGGVYLLRPFGGTPTADYVKIATDEFRISADTGGSGDVDIYWNFTNGDRLHWDGVVDAVRFYFAGVNTLTLFDTVVEDEANAISIGRVITQTTGEFFNSIAAREFVPADAPSVPSTSPGTPPHRINARTTPMLMAHVTSAGLTVSGLSHNVQTSSKVGTGDYTITPWIDTTTGGSGLNIFVTVESGSGIGFAIAKYNTGTSKIEVKTYDAAGTLQDREFSVIAFDGGWI